MSETKVVCLGVEKLAGRGKRWAKSGTVHFTDESVKRDF
jgi:hypothetical protein